METDRDHIHFLISYDATDRVCDIVKTIKQQTTFYLWKKYSNFLSKQYWKKKIFWSDWYFTCSIPYTIQLLYENKPVLQPLMAGIDPGRTNIGVSVVNKNAEPVFSAVVETRNKVINNQRERTYKLNGEIVAKNRKPRFEQKGPALSDWYEEQVERCGRQEADRMRSQLTVEKSTRRYNDPNRLTPGALFEYMGEYHVLSGQLSNGQYFRAYGDKKTNHPAKKCRIIRHNEGLVFVA